MEFVQRIQELSSRYNSQFSQVRLAFCALTQPNCMQFSDFGQRFRGSTGIGQLMRDLADDPDSDPSLPRYRLGGGNPATLPAALIAFQHCVEQFAADSPRFASVLGAYPPPKGDARFINALVALFNDHCGWPVTAANVMLTNGSQNAFFMLFNLLAGSCNGRSRKILLPMAPEYIGYSDVAVGDSLFTARRPDIELIGPNQFKYHPAANDTGIGGDIAAVCVSRPTNPTGNVLSDQELARLDQAALAAGIPLIIDNAYGAPFPNIIHVPATLHWHDNIILSMSLSKIGLPATRTGIVVAHPDIIDALTEMNAVFNLSPAGLATSAFAPLIETGEILKLSDTVLRPFYQQRAADALSWFANAFDGLPARAHKPEGSLFLWLWFEGLPITTRELYERLKQQGVIVVPGHYFFPGIEDNWRHCEECIRVNVAGNAAEIRAGLAIIADAVKVAHHTHN